MNIRHPGQLKKSKSWGPFWSYWLKSTANFAHLPKNQVKWAELAVLFSWQLQNGPQDFDLFNSNGCQTFILYEIHCYLSPLKSCHNNSFLGSVSDHIRNVLSRLQYKLHNSFYFQFLFLLTTAVFSLLFNEYKRIGAFLNPQNLTSNSISIQLYKVHTCALSAFRGDIREKSRKVLNFFCQTRQSVGK